MDKTDARFLDRSRWYRQNSRWAEQDKDSPERRTRDLLQALETYSAEATMTMAVTRHCLINIVRELAEGPASELKEAQHEITRGLEKLKERYRDILAPYTK